MDAAISISRVAKRFAGGTQALAGVSLAVRRGEFVAIVGPSGCGKSTLLRMVAGLEPATQGGIRLAEAAHEPGMPPMSFVFQEPTLMPWASVFDNVWLPLRLAGRGRAEAGEQVRSLLDLVGLTGFEAAYPRELSGGMKMRVSIARALASRPWLMLLDEPFAALDEITRGRLNDDLLDWWAARGLTALFVTHSVYEAVYLSQRIVVMSARPGRVLDRADGRRALSARRCVPRLAALRAAVQRSFGRLAGGAPGDALMAAQPGGRLVTVGVPALVLVAALLAWEALVRIAQIPHYILPAPSLILATLWENFGSLAQSWWFTIRITFGALLLSAVLGVALAALFAMSPWIERSLFPFAIVLQVTPIVAIAPLILIYVDSTTAALLICAWIVAFFPVLSNTVIGLRSTDANLSDLFTMYRATRWQRLRLLLVPSALPYFIAGLKIAGGLSLIGAVVAEFTAGAAGRETGLASRILEASFRTEVPKMFAALLLVSLTGVAIFLLFNLLSRWLLGRWHESERR